MTVSPELERCRSRANTVKFHPTALTTRGLSKLSITAAKRYVESPTFCIWILDFCAAEQFRRMRAKFKDFREPQMPVLPCMSNAELADAMIWCEVAGRSLRNRSALEFLSEVQLMLTVKIAHRLKGNHGEAQDD